MDGTSSIIRTLPNRRPPMWHCHYRDGNSAIQAWTKTLAQTVSFPQDTWRCHLSRSLTAPAIMIVDILRSGLQQLGDISLP